MLFGFFASLVLVASIAAFITFRGYFTNDNCEMIHRYFDIANNITVDENCHIGVGYSSWIDLNIDASEFFKIYDGKIDTTGIVARNHKEIMSHQDFLETFLFFFKEGASSERVAMNATIIKEISQWINEMGLDHYKEVGGHAAKFAERMSMEKWKVFFPGSFNNFTVAHMDSLNINAHDWDGVDEVEDEENYDIHICILYQTGEEFYGYESIRSNRFYLINDPKGSKLSYVEDYHNTMAKFEGKNLTPTKHMFAGYQYMEAKPKYEAKARFKVIKEEWEKMKEKDPSHTIHIELAHFNYHHTIHYIMKYLFNHTDSIGFNEQEMYAIYNQLIFYKNKDEAENDEHEIGPSSSRLTVSESLNLLSKLIKKLLVERYPNISRVQYHTLGHMITWYNPDIWEPAEDSLIKTGLTSATYCALHSKNVDTPLWKSHAMKKLVLEDHSSNMTAIEGYAKHNNTADFLKFYKIDDSNFICGIITTPTCRKPTKLTGLGDNISSTGFTYQNKIVNARRQE